MISGFLIGIAAFDLDWTYLFVQKMFAYIPDVLAALVVLLVGNVLARFLARSVLIGAVNLNLQYARFLSIGVKWIVIVLAFAMSSRQSYRQFSSAQLEKRIRQFPSLFRISDPEIHPA